MKQFIMAIFNFDNNLVSIINIIEVVILVVLTFLVGYFIHRFFKYQQNKGKLTVRVARKLMNLIIVSVLIIDSFIVLNILGLNLQSILEYRLISLDPVEVTPFHILLFLIAIIVVQFLVLGIRRIFDNLIENKGMDIGVGRAIYQIIKYAIWIIVIILLLDSAGLKLTILFAGFGALLIGIGFGVQQIFSDIISGFTLLFERNLKVHDVVEVDGIVGRVQDIHLRTSRIVTRDNIEMLIPNTKFISDNVVNWSHLEEATRFNVKVGVAYGSDVRLVERILLDCARAHSQVLDEPEPIVFFKDFGNSSLDFELFFWTHNAFRFEKIRSDLRFAIDDAFRKNNVTIPFPQRDIHMRTK